MSSKKIVRIVIMIAIVVCAVILLKQEISKRQIKQLTKAGEFFGSYVKVDVCYAAFEEKKLQKAMDDVWARFGDIHTRLSVYDAKSDINKINAAYQAPVKVQSDTYQLIKDSLEYHRSSFGVFDITLGALIKLWKSKGKEGMMPTSDEIAQAKSLVNVQAIELLSDNQIILKQEGVKVNIDSIGDGFAADEAARILRAQGFKNFLIDASGEMYAGGENCSGKKWRIGVRDPSDTTKIMEVLEVSNLGVSTSGSYERFYEIDGRKWSHIIDPRSGYPAEGIVSATVVAPSAQYADFLSTAFCILSPQKSFFIVDELGEGYAATVVLGGPDQNGEKQSSVIYDKYLAK